VVDGITTRNPLVADYSEWKARDYFDTYYSEVVLPDEQAVLAYQIDVLKAARARFGRGLEYGCGPTLHRAIAASKYAFRIDMADWLAENLAEAREWLCADVSAPEWQRFTSGNAGGEAEFLFGRKTYQMMASFWPTPQALQTMPAVAKAMNAARKIVFSRTLTEATWRNSRIVKGDPFSAQLMTRRALSSSSPATTPRSRRKSVARLIALPHRPDATTLFCCFASPPKSTSTTSSK